MGIINKLINNLPFEAHLPGGYRFCGPGTKLEKRLKRGDLPINGLDAACRTHDIAYRDSGNDLRKRHEADRVLVEEAWKRVLNRDANISEKANALLVTNIMKSKLKLGAGMSRRNTKKVKKPMVGKGRKRISFARFRKMIGDQMKRSKPKTVVSAIESALKTAKAIKVKKNVTVGKVPGMIRVPKTGGFLPLIPIMAALGTLKKSNPND